MFQLALYKKTWWHPFGETLPDGLRPANASLWARNFWALYFTMLET